MTFEQRLERLERQNRWMRRIGAAGVALMATLLLVGQGQQRELQHLNVRSLTVVDAEGKARAQLGTNPEGSPHLVLRDSVARGRMALGMNGNGSPAIALTDETGQARAVLGATDGRTSASSLTLYDPGGKVIWQAPAAPDDATEVALQKCKYIYDLVSMWKILTRSEGPPASLSELEKPIRKSAEPFWNVEKDPWGAPYRIELLDGGKFRIWSNGPDRREASGDDLCYPPRDD